MRRALAVAAATLALAAPVSAHAYDRFTSPLYAYSLFLPLGWSATAATAAWSGALSVQQPDADTFASAERRESLAAAAVRTTASRSGWHAEATRAARGACSGPLVTGSTLRRFGGVRATLTAYRCDVGTYLTIATLRRNDVGYAFAWTAHGANARATWTELEGILDSLEFGRAA